MMFRDPDAERLTPLETAHITNPLNATTIINCPIERIGQHRVRAIARKSRSRGALGLIGVSPFAFSRPISPPVEPTLT